MTPPSPSASLYAVSDNEEGEYNTITHKSSGKGVKLLCSKSKVRLFGPLIYRLDLPAPRSTCIPRHQPGTTLPDLLRSSNRKVQHQNDNPSAHLPPLPLQHLLNHHQPHPSSLLGFQNIHLVTPTTHTSKLISPNQHPPRNNPFSFRRFPQPPRTALPWATMLSLFLSTKSTLCSYGHQA